MFLARCFPSTPIPIYSVGPADLSSPVRSAYSPVWACVGHDQQIEVAPGSERVDTLTIVGPHGRDHATREPIGTLMGSMRLLYQVRTCRGDTLACVIPDAGISAPFTVSLQGSPDP